MEGATTSSKAEPQLALWESSLQSTLESPQRKKEGTGPLMCLTTQSLLQACGKIETEYLDPSSALVGMEMKNLIMVAIDALCYRDPHHSNRLRVSTSQSYI